MSRRAWNGATPVVGIDVDGTLGRYHEHFLTFARGWLGVRGYWPGPMVTRNERTTTGEPIPWTDDGYFGECSLAEYMGISKATYRKCKLAYRRGGLKRSMPPYPGARDLMVGLRKRAWVVVCTTRPYLHLDNIEPDTVEWLRRNMIPYDGILMGEHKYRNLKAQYGDMAAAVLDDDPALLSQARGLGMAAMLMVRTHNGHHWSAAPWWTNSTSGALVMLTDYLRHDWPANLDPKNEDWQ